MNFSAVKLLIAVAALVSLAYSQTPATCTFKTFNVPGTVNGVNDYGTTVGTTTSRGFIRSSGGALSYYSAPNSAGTGLNARNDAGVMVGSYTSPGSNSSIPKGFIVQGSTFKSFVHSGSVWGTTLTGINKYNTSVGWYADASEMSHGFKRYSNGGLVALNFPKGQFTTPSGINDSGTVVGSFSDSAGEHGFIYHGGTWAKVDYPGSAGATQVVGISNSNVVVGFTTNPEPISGFLYANGVYKSIMLPNSFYTQPSGVSAKGLITGMVLFNGQSTAQGFIATCK